MAREDRLIYERVKKERLTTPVLTTDHVEYIKNVLIDALRDVFSRDPDYTYISDPATGDPMWGDPGGGPGINPGLGIVIRDVYDYEVEFLPAITIRVNGGTIDDVSFSQNQFTYDYARDAEGNLILDDFSRPIPIYQEYSGIYNTTAVVFIHAFDTVSREEITTRVGILFKHLLRDQLYADCGVFVKSVSISGESETPYQEGNDHIYSQSITLDILTGWTNRIPVGPELEAVNLQIIGDMVTPQQVRAPKDIRRGINGEEVTPSRSDLELSTRTDWIDEIRTCPVLVLADALEFRGNPMQPELYTTADWIEILTRFCGITIEEAIAQINGPSSLARSLIGQADVLRQKADRLRINRQDAARTGSPALGFTYRFHDGTKILPDDTVVFPNNVRMDPNNNMITITGVRISKAGAITLPVYGRDSNIDLAAFVDPFTAITLEDLTGWNFFLILLYVDSCARQSIMGLNKLIDSYVLTLTDVRQILVVQDLQRVINELAEHRFLLGKVYPDIALSV